MEDKTKAEPLAVPGPRPCTKQHGTLAQDFASTVEAFRKRNDLSQLELAAFLHGFWGNRPGNAGAPQLWTAQEVATHFRVSRETVKRWIRRGRIHATQIGRHTLVTLSEVRRLEREGT